MRQRLSFNPGDWDYSSILSRIEDPFIQPQSKTTGSQNLNNSLCSAHDAEANYEEAFGTVDSGGSMVKSFMPKLI
jgi:hypothetical protein